MRLTLNAAETGHLVLATAHSATTAEALQRVVAAFPSEIQNSVCAQLADCLVAVVCQRLQYRADLRIQVPECEILIPSTHAVKNFIRRGEFFKMMSSMETGAEAGMWTYQRYRTWLDSKRNWAMPGQSGDEGASEELPALEEPAAAPPPMTRASSQTHAPEAAAGPAAATPAAAAAQSRNRDGLLEIEPEEGGLEAIISELKNKT